MKMRTQTETRLSFTLGVPYFNSSTVDLDRGTGRATIKRAVLFWPMKPIEIPLSEIASVRLATSRSGTGESSAETSYPELTLVSGRRIALGAVSAFGSKALVRLIATMNAFLFPPVPGGSAPPVEAASVDSRAGAAQP